MPGHQNSGALFRLKTGFFVLISRMGMSDEDILGDLSPCGLISPNFENLDLPGWVGGGRMVISVCAGGLV